MKQLDRRLAALEAQYTPDPIVVQAIATSDPMNPHAAYRIVRETVIDPSEPFDYFAAVAMIAPQEEA